MELITFAFLELQLISTRACLLLLYVVPIFLLFILVKKKSISFFINFSKELNGYKYWQIQPTSDAVKNSPSSTYVLRIPLGYRIVFTGNASNVEHILKTSSSNYIKGDFVRSSMLDLLGDGIFNANGESWKFQRHVTSREFKANSFRNFLEQVIETEISERLVPILTTAAESKTVLDFQDILQRFAFDNICKIVVGYDPASLLPSRPQSKLQQAFDKAARISTRRLGDVLWKIKRLLDVGSENELRMAVNEVRKFAKQLVESKKQELKDRPELEHSKDLLSRILVSNQYLNENLVMDIVISFIFAGSDSTASTMTWFFWLISGSPNAESNILSEIRTKSKTPTYEQVKDMVYTHASLCEAMRLYPAVPMDLREAVEDDVLPDGTVVKKGTNVVYHPYAMGRLEELWGKDWADFRPERWLRRHREDNKWTIIAKDPYSYPVFHAGSRVCLGKEMSFLQMKRVVYGVLQRFRVVPALDDGFEPVLEHYVTLRMKDGLPVRIEKRVEVLDT